MGRNRSSFPPTTWPTFRSPQETTRSRRRHAHSPRAGTWHPQRPARVDRLGRSVPVWLARSTAPPPRGWIPFRL